MSSRDRLRRARSRIKALRDNVPDRYEIESNWVQEFHDAIDSLEKELTNDLTEFRVPSVSLYRSIASGNYLTGETTYPEGLWCQVPVLRQKIDALIYYLDDLYDESAPGD